MYRRLLTPVLALMVLMTAVPAAAQTPAASPIATGTYEMRALDLAGQGFAISPDGQWLAGVGPDQTPCFWDVETLTPQCAGEKLPILVHQFFPAIAWAPDSSAVAFSLDAPRMAYDSDIYVFERESGALTNLTDDGYAGSLLDGPDDLAIDIVPTWSPDGTQIVFSRSRMGDMTKSTSVMRIERAGGEPIEIVTLDIEEPLVIWMPMHWLPDDTILYTLSSAKIDEQRNGLWRVGVDGANPEKLIPGDGTADIPAPVAADVNLETGVMSVFSPLLLAQFGASPEQPVFWLGDLDDGSVRPLPLYDAESGETLDPASVQPTDTDATPLLALPAGPAALSPDGATALAVYRNMAGESSLMRLDPATGEVATVAPFSPETLVQPLAPQWADNGTVLILTGDGAMLLTPAPAG